VGLPPPGRRHPRPQARPPRHSSLAADVKFYLGTHHDGWLAELTVPLFVSHRRLFERRRLPRARTSWALDSGGFTEVTLHGGWQTREVDYLEAVERYATEIGRLDWAAPMDWMCEPLALEKTGLSVDQHIGRTIENYCHLHDARPDLPIIPVVQGWQLGDYLRCVAGYSAAGINLLDYEVVGLGTICRRQGTAEANQIVRELSDIGLHLHAFGAKITGLRSYGCQLASSDSLAWSYNARRHPPLRGCEGKHKNCANCWKWAIRWRRKLLNDLAHRDSR